MSKHFVAAVGLATLAGLSMARPSLPSDEPDELMPGTAVVVRGPGNRVRFLSRAAVPFDPPDAGNDPRVEGATLRVFDTGGAAGDDTYALPAGGWNGLGNPPGAGGFRYQGSPSDPCRVAVVKTNLVKALCRGGAITLSPPFSGDVGLVLTVGTDSKRYCATWGGTTKRNVAGLLRRTSAPAPGSCPESSTTTTSTVTTTTATLPASCCGAERITLSSSVGSLQIDNLAPSPIPAGIVTTMDSGPAGGAAGECRHDVVIPLGGFSMPHFDLPALNYCSELIDLHCESGSGEGAGALWDGNGTAGVAMTNVTKNADTSDGVCGPLGTGCNFNPGGAGADTLGDVDATVSAAAGSGVRSLVDIRVRSRTWADSVCQPAFTPGCCATAIYGDDTEANGEVLITLYDYVLSLTTNTATAAFVDKNGDGCKRSGSGFPSPGIDGPKSTTGTPASGPCCVVGQTNTAVAVGVGFTGGAPLYDTGFLLTIPNTVASCGSASTGSCVVTTDPCLQ